MILTRFLADSSVRAKPHRSAAVAALATVAITVALVAGTAASPALAANLTIATPGLSSTDQIAVDSSLHRVFVLGADSGHPGGRALTIIDSRTDTVIGAPIPLAAADFIANDYVTHKASPTARLRRSSSSTAERAP